MMDEMRYWLGKAVQNEKLRKGLAEECDKEYKENGRSDYLKELRQQERKYAIEYYHCRAKAFDVLAENLMEELNFESEQEMRDWLMENIDG